MFGGRKTYAPVRSYDQETGGRSSPRSRKASSSWKKYAILGGVAVGVILFIGAGHYRRAGEDQWELEEGGRYQGGQYCLSFPCVSAGSRPYLGSV
jgi:hypothetical protein